MRVWYQIFSSSSSSNSSMDGAFRAEFKTSPFFQTSEEGYRVYLPVLPPPIPFRSRSRSGRTRNDWHRKTSTQHQSPHTTYRETTGSSLHSRKRRRHTQSSGRSLRTKSGDRRKRRHRSPKEERPTDVDKDGHLIYYPDDVLDSRYIIIGTLGEGTFGKVAHCRHKYTGEEVAVKIIKNVEKYRYSAKIEIRILESISKASGDGKKLCVKMLDWFDHNGHICIVFELLGLSVFDYLKDNEYQPYTIENVRDISYQLLKSIKFLHEHNLTHTDLKPENIMFVESRFTERQGKRAKRVYHYLDNSEIRLIDFGSATHDDEHHSTIVSTRHYRGPEVSH